MTAAPTAEPGDFILYRQTGERKATLAKIRHRRGDRFQVDLQMQGNRETLTIQRDDIVANLGTRLREGRAFGVSIWPNYGTINTNMGPYYIGYHDMEADEKDTLKQAADSAGRLLSKERLLGGFEVTYHAMIGTSPKIAGHYIPGKKTGINKIAIYRVALRSRSDARYVMLHEYGHGVYRNLLDAEAQARWALAWRNHCEESSASADEVKAMLDGLARAADLKAWRKTLNRHGELGKSLLMWICKTNHLSSRELNQMLKGGVDIRPFLPRPQTYRPAWTQPTIPFSEYANKNSEEAFCEGFALYVSDGGSLGSFQSLMEKILSRVRLRIRHGE